MTLDITIDLLLAFGVLVLAWLSVFSSSLFQGVVFFITMGILVTITWVRLQAVDVAIAEASIGAGLTGALLISALAKLKKPHSITGREPE